MATTQEHVRLPQVELCFATPDMDENVVAAILAAFESSYRDISHERGIPANLVFDALKQCGGHMMVCACTA